MRRGFTLVEVSILLVIFLIVALLVAPMSLDDTRQARNTSRWRNVQIEFSNIFYSPDLQKIENSSDFKTFFRKSIESEIREDIPHYKITFLNGMNPPEIYSFNNYKLTGADSVLAYKFMEKQAYGLQGLLMYDVNGKEGPNKWGNDVFGFNIYSDRLEPFCKKDSIETQKRDCSKNGTGLCCSNYYLIGGSFD